MNQNMISMWPHVYILCVEYTSCLYAHGYVHNIYVKPKVIVTYLPVSGSWHSQ